MRKSRFSEEQIIAILKESEAGVGTEELCRRHGITRAGINRGAASLAVTFFQLFPHKGKAEVLLDQPQQMILRNLIFQAEVVEQRFRTIVLSHHEQQASEDDELEHGKKSSPYYHVPAAIPSPITVTFSTPTGVSAH